MKQYTKWLLLVLALVMVFTMAACGNKDDGEKAEPTDPPLNMGTPDCTHVWGEWEETVESTCTKKGTQLRSCTLCGKEEQKRIPATGHYYNDGVCAACGRNERACEHQTTERIVIKEATCTQRGQVNILCTICDAVIAVDDIYPTGHGQLTTIVEREPTCVDNGRAKEVCTLCGEVESSYTLYSEGHNDTEWVVIKEPTCTESGHKQRICHTCEQIIDESFPYETGHQNTEWVEVKKPTCTETGYSQKICHTCETVVSESYPSAIGHSYQYVSEKAPTCTEGGWYSYHYCDVCDYSNLEEKARPAKGHNNIAGLCGTCGAKDPTFVATQIAGITKLEHVIDKPTEKAFNAPAAVFLKSTVEVAEGLQIQTFTMDATQTGTYYFWITELYSGNSLKIYVKDYLGQTVEYSNNVSNNGGFSTQLTAGQTYTVEVTMRSVAVAGTCFLNTGCQTATADVSAYTAIHDSMSFKNQVNYYTFTPSVDGAYRLWFSNVVSGLDMNIYVYNDLEEVVTYSTGCGNNEGINLNNLAAGKTYLIKVVYRSGQGPYTLNLGKQQATVDVSKYNTIQDNLYFNNQVNRYTFTVPANGNYRIQMGNITGSLYVRLYVYNSLGETVANNDVRNDGGFTLTNLVAGQTYTITVGYYNGSTPYTLYIYGQKPVVELTDNTGAVDSFEYKNQSNTYTFTAEEGGTYRIAITDMVSGANVTVYIYDANGQAIKSDSYISNGEYFTLTDLVPGATYTIKVSCNGVLTEYVISVQ